MDKMSSSQEKKKIFNQILFLNIWSLKTPANTIILYANDYYFEYQN